MRAQVFETIHDVDPQDWDALLNERSITFSHTFWKIIEESRLNDFRYRYVLFRDEDDQPVALATFYVVTTDIAIFSPPWLRRWLESVRRVFPGFLKLRMLECGTPIILNSPPIVLHPDIDPGEIVDRLHDVLKTYARRNRIFLVILRDFEKLEANWALKLGDLGYQWILGLPNTYLNIFWDSVEEYRAALKSYYRSKINNHLRKNAELGVRHDLIEDFSGISEELCRQWHVVHERANEFQREVLTSDFYRELSLRLGGRAKIIRFFREEIFVGHALLLHDKDTLRWLYFGRSEPVNDSLYLYVIQAVIQAGIDLKVRRIEMGLTTYPIKLDVGARLEPIHYAICCTYSVLNPLIGWGYGLLNKPSSVQDKAVFKNDGSKEGP